MKVRNLLKALVPIAAVGALLCACTSGGGSAAPSPGAAPSGNLTIWAYGALSDTPQLQPLVDGFEKKYPKVKVTLQPQPSNNYYPLLKTAIISKNGPDIFGMFPGSYQTQFANYSLDLSKLIPQDTLKSVGAQYYSAAGTTTSKVYGVPNTKGMYYMLYNKSVLKAAGVSSVPTTFDQMSAACAKIKATGKTCLAYGSDPGSSQFFAAPDFSYMFSSVPLSDWNKLIDGSMKYNSPQFLADMKKYVSFHAKGYTNPDVMTWKDYRNQFIAGNAAFYMTGSWDGAWASKGLGDNVAAAPIPWSDSPMSNLVQLPDSGWSVNKDTQNQTAAVAFLNYSVSQEGQNIVSQSGSMPALTGTVVQNKVNAGILAQAKAQGWKIYPMFDNFVATPVGTALASAFNQALAGQITPSTALKQVDQATAGVPSDQRLNYNLGASQ